MAEEVRLFLPQVSDKLGIRAHAPHLTNGPKKTHPDQTGRHNNV